MEATTALLTAIRAALLADATVSGLVGARVYDRPPALCATPYITMGLLSYRDISASDAALQDFSVSVSVFDQPTGGDQNTTGLRTLMARVRTVLHRQPLTISGASHIVTNVIGGQTLPDPDGVSFQGVTTVQVLVQNS